MKCTAPRKIQLTSLATIVLACFLTACTSQQMNDSVNAMSQKAFEYKLAELTGEASEAPDYKAIPIETAADQNWFIDLAYRYYSKDISQGQFIQEGLRRFPGYGESFAILAGLLVE
ncbi:hypothetical protein [Aurantivibrio plasticivorans]